jgi:hypothetical protein
MSKVGGADGIVFEGARELLVLQFSDPDPLPELDIDAFVTTLCVAAVADRRHHLRDGAAWSLWLAVDRPHPEGCGSWIGIDAPASSALAVAIEVALCERGCSVRRESAAIAASGMRPLLRVRPDGIDVPERAPSGVEELCAGFEVERVPFRVLLTQVWKQDLMSTLMLGDAGSPLLDLPYYRDDPAAEYVLGRVDLQMFLRLPDATVIAAARASDTPPVILTFELPAPHVLELFELLPADTSRDISTLLMGPTPFKVPPGTCVVGVRAYAGAPDPNGCCSYVVSSLFAPQPAWMEVRF